MCCFSNILFVLLFVQNLGFAKLLTLQGIQKGEDQSVSRFVAEHCGMYLESEIVDKHLTFIR